MAEHKNVVHLSQAAMETIEAPGGSRFGGMRQRVGMMAGAKRLGYSFFIVFPGHAAFPYHAHSGNEEMIYITDGEGILRFGKEELTVSAGTFIACPPGPDYPHQLINTGTRELRYLVVSSMDYPDISEYPDSGKIGAYATSPRGSQVGFRALYRKDENVNYYDGEDGKEVERVLEAVTKR
jgi:uncharacterized cupin superfamily protein